MPWVCLFIKLTHGLAQRPTLSHCNLVTDLDTESWADVHWNVGMSLLVSGVLGDEVEVFPTNNDCAVHLCGHDSAGEDTSANGHEASEGAFLVCVEIQMLADMLPSKDITPRFAGSFLFKSSALFTSPQDHTYRCIDPQSHSSVS